MKRVFATIILIFAVAIGQVAAQKKRTPVYIVNGERMTEEQVRNIEPEDIVDNHLLEVNESVIAKYGNDAANGVIIITLRYDTPARFEIEGKECNYSAYIAEQVKWEDTDGVARVIIKFMVGEDGSISETDVLEATDKRLLRRVENAMEVAPKWIPAMKDGKGVATDHLLKITLPQGRKMPREQVIRIRG